MPLDLFSKTPLPESLPEKMQITVDELKKSSGKEDCLKKVYGIMTRKYRGYRVKTYTRFFEVFKKDIGCFWGREGFLHCTNMNFVMRTLLVKSGFFSEEDLNLKWTQIWYVSPHQFLQVNVDGKWIDIDIWANTYGVGFGDHASGFN